MGSTTTEVEKKPYRNQTAGWQGVVKLNHLGAQEGHGVAPYGTVWLTDDEAKLTARAPARAEDNPFLPKPFDFYDDKGAIVTQEMAPIVLVTDERDVPIDDRYVPAHPITGVDEAKLNADAADVETALGGAERPVPTEATAEPTLAPSALAAVPPSQATARAQTPPHEADRPEEDVAPSWVDNPERTEGVQQGSLGGADGAVGPSDAALADGPTGASPTATSVAEAQTPGAVAEEHAAVTETGEETGAAETPTGDAPEGEFAQHEEVGSPDAPTQGGE